MSISYTFEDSALIAVTDNRVYNTPCILDENNNINQAATKIEIQKLILLQHNEEQNQKFILDTRTFRDDVYMDGTLSKSDYSINSTTGQSIVSLLETTWPDEVSSYTQFTYNLASEFSPNRLPYVNNSISWYSFEEPTNDIKTTYNLSYSSYMPWYGLKFDKVTEEVMAKIVLPQQAFLEAFPTALDNVTLPEFWNDIRFFAKIHKKDGSVDTYFDVYANSPEDLMDEWCTENNISFPYDKTDTSIKSNLLIWGLTIDGITGEIAHVKAYTRTYLS